MQKQKCRYAAVYVSSERAFGALGFHQGYELNRFLIEFKRHLQVRVQVQRSLFFEFKFEFGKNDRVHGLVQKIP